VLICAHVKGARFQGADLRDANLGGLKLVDAGLFKGALISARSATFSVIDLGEPHRAPLTSGGRT